MFYVFFLYIFLFIRIVETYHWFIDLSLHIPIIASSLYPNTDITIKWRQLLPFILTQSTKKQLR